MVSGIHNICVVAVCKEEIFYLHERKSLNKQEFWHSIVFANLVYYYLCSVKESTNRCFLVQSVEED